MNHTHINNARWEKAKILFNSALSFPDDRRGRFLDDACAGDPELRREVESLIDSFEKADDFIETPVVEDALKLFNWDSGQEVAGRRIGNYEIIREIGHGGMGVVYLAARADDEYRKQVAIKLVRQGFDSQFIVSRFVAERQILADLDHPTIARLFDGGTTEAGLPYLVMEYVEGLPIDAYCDRHKLSPRERLKLFRTVCAAVQYAHQHLVIHRDIKPSNILVTEDGTPKLLDFGIAKMLTPDGATQALEQTATAVRLMTPDYASPEQVMGRKVNTASDIYSLGVLLYELLTGHRPYRFKTPLPHEIERVICEQEPERPSTVIRRVEEVSAADGLTSVTISPETVSSDRNTQPDKLRRLLSGDLDNIVLMAMRKEPGRRYSSVEQFSEDLRRYLEGLPIIARKDTLTYRASKFVGRNKVAVAAAVIILLLLVGGMAATAWQARVARREKAHAESVSAFLEQMLSYSNPVASPSQNKEHATTMEEAIDEAARRLEGDEFASQPEVKAELERVIGLSYNFQGRYDLAFKHLHAYVTTQSGLNAENHPKSLDAAATWATLLVFKGDMAGAEAVYRRVLPLLRSEQQKGHLKAENLAGSLTSFAYLRRTQGDSKEAESLFREVLALSRQIPAESRYLVGLTHSTLASTIADQGRFDEALQTSREAVAEYRQRQETNTPSYGFALTVLSGFLTDRGEYPEADASLREAEAIFRKLLAPSALWLGDNLRNQGVSLYQQGKYSEALGKADEAEHIYLESFGTHYDHYPTVLIIQGLSLSRLGKLQEGEKRLREAARIRTELLPAGHYWIAIANSALGDCLTTQGRFAEAEPLLLESYDSLKNSQSPNSGQLRAALQRLVTLYKNWGKPDAAAVYGSKSTS